jgi:hypothetical protein
MTACIIQLAAIVLQAGPAPAATGDLVGSVTFSQNCGGGLGVGIAYDGTNLWYSCAFSSPDLLRADPKTGVVSASYNITGGLGALAYDATRNAIWAGPAQSFGNIWLIQLDASKKVTSSAVKFNAGADGSSLDDGLGYDATDDTLYISPDTSTVIHHYRTDGTKISDFAWAGKGCYNSGVAIGGNLLFEGSDGCNHVWVVNKTAPATVVFDFSTQVAGDPNFRDEGLTCDTNTFAPKQVMWSKEAYSPMRAHAFEIPAGTCGVGGQPPAPLTMTGRAYAAVASVVTPLQTATLAPTPDTGYVTTTMASSTSTPCTLTTAGVVTAGVLCANVTTALNPAQSTATASVVSATINSGIPGVPMITATGVKSTSKSTCTGSSGTATIDSLLIDGVAQNTSVGPDSAISVSGPVGAKLILNEQVPVSGGLTVNAVHLIVPATNGVSADVVIASATSDIHNCP